MPRKSYPNNFNSNINLAIAFIYILTLASDDPACHKQKPNVVQL